MYGFRVLFRDFRQLSDNRALPLAGAHEPERPNGHALDLAVGLPCAIDHPLNIVLVVDAEIPELALAHGG